jgi:hypothetical protein
MRACVFSEEWIRERATVIDVTQRSEDGAIIKALMRRVRAPDAASSQTGYAVFPHQAFMNGLSRSEERVLAQQG